MKYIQQASIIFLFAFLGETLARLLPLPVPAAIWGLILLFLALCTGAVKEEWIKDAAHGLVTILPVLFVAPTVNLMEQVGLLMPCLSAVLVIIPVCMLLTFFASGGVTQRLLDREAQKKHE